MKSSENFIEAIRNYLDSRAESDNLFAIRYADPSKSLSECCQFILNEVKRQGVSVMTNDEVFRLRPIIGMATAPQRKSANPSTARW